MANRQDQVKEDNVLVRLLLYFCLYLVIILWSAPIVWMISTSLKPENQVFSYPPKWIPKTFTLENYATILREFPIDLWLYNSVVVAVLTTIIVLIIDSLAAYAFARMDFKGRDFLFMLVLSTLMIPIQASVVPLFLLMTKLRLADTYVGLILPQVANPLGIFLLRQFFSGIPVELEDAAKIDGCSRMGILIHIILPLSLPVLATLAIFTFVASWNNFLWPLIITRTETVTLPVGLSSFSSGVGEAPEARQYGIVMAASGFATFPVLLIFLFLQRYYIRGITFTSIKG